MIDNLPPLPKGDITYHITDSVMRQLECDAHSDRQMQAYASAAIEADRVSRDVPELCDPSCGTYDLASMILSDCGHGTNNQRLLDRVAARIDKRLSAVLAASPQPQPSWWQPIDTAPKNCRILIGRVGHPWAVTAQWNERKEYWSTGSTPMDFFAEPTHWMPLPPPPAEQAQKEE